MPGPVTSVVADDSSSVKIGEAVGQNNLQPPTATLTTAASNFRRSPSARVRFVDAPDDPDDEDKSATGSSPSAGSPVNTASPVKASGISTESVDDELSHSDSDQDVASAPSASASSAGTAAADREAGPLPGAGQVKSRKTLTGLFKRMLR